MRRVILFLGVIALMSPTAFAQDTLWTKTYGGSLNDVGISVFQTADGGYAVGGYTNSPPAQLYDCYLLRTDENGDSLWAKTYGGEGSQYVNCLQQTTDGGFVMTGITEGIFLDSPVYLLKTDSDGDSIWAQTYGADSLSETSTWVEQTSDGGYIISGHTWRPVTGFDFFLIKTDPDGNEEWTRYYAWPNADYAYCVRQTSDGGYIVTGGTSSNELYEFDVLLMKLDAVGDSVWAARYGGDDDDRGDCVLETSDGDYIIAGSTESFGAGGQDVYLIKTDEGGDTLWTRTLGDTYHDAATAVAETSDGGYVVTGAWTIPGVTLDAYVVRLDVAGNVLWSGLYGGEESETGYSIQQTDDGGYILVASTLSFGAGEVDIYLVKLAPDAVNVEDNSDGRLSLDFVLCQNYPNPFNASTVVNYQLPVDSHVKLEVHNILGEKIGVLVDEMQETGYKSVSWDASELASGIYFYKLTAGHFTETKRMMLVK
ncbi:MAG: T9SS type A sorting domain-containing protein [Candidatus Zixiibacteriota bacterium]